MRTERERERERESRLVVGIVGRREREFGVRGVDEPDEAVDTITRGRREWGCSARRSNEKPVSVEAG